MESTARSLGSRAPGPHNHCIQLLCGRVSEEKIGGVDHGRSRFRRSLPGSQAGKLPIRETSLFFFEFQYCTCVRCKLGATSATYFSVCHAGHARHAGLPGDRRHAFAPSRMNGTAARSQEILRFSLPSSDTYKPASCNSAIS